MTNILQWFHGSLFKALLLISIILASKAVLLLLQHAAYFLHTLL